MRRDLILIICIALLVFAFLAPLLFNLLGVFFDDYYETFSQLFFNARAVQQGALPLWDPHTFAGGRINFIPNTRIWYWPLYLFYPLVSLGSMSAAYTGLIKIPLLIHWLIAALTAYGLGRFIIRLHPIGATALALTYAFGSAMSYNICDPGTIYAIVWIPLVLWGIASYARYGNRWMLAAGVFALSFIGPCGSDVRGLFSLMVIAITVGFLALVASFQKIRPLVSRLIVAGLLVFIIGLLLSGPYWTAMTETLSIYRESPLLAATRSASDMFSVPWRYIITMFVPDFFGSLTGASQIDLGIPVLSDYSHVEGNITGGYWLMAICLIGSIMGWSCRANSPEESIRRRWWIVGLLLFILSLLLITGRYSLVYRYLIRMIPVFGLPYAVRWRIMHHLGLALLAGVSVHWLWTIQKPLPRWGLIVFLVTILSWVGWQWMERVSPEGTRLFSYASVYYRGWLLTGPIAYLAAAVVLTIFLIIFHKKIFARSLILLVGAIEILVFGFLVVYFLSWGDAPEWIRYPEPSATAYYQWTDHDSLTNLPSPPTGPERSAYYFSLLDQVATLHGGDYLLGHCSKPLAPRLLDIVESITAGYPYALRITQPGSNYFSNMSVRHLILNHPDALPLEKALFRRLEGGGGLYDYRLESTLPRVFTQDRSVLCSSEEAMNELMNGDLRSAVFIEDGKQLAANGKQWGEGGEKLVSYNEFLNLGQGEKDIEHFDELQKRNQIYRVWYPNSNLMNIEIDVKVPALLITTDVFYAGWEVCVDGEDKIPLRVNYCQRGIWLDEGNHVVKWTFRPPAVKWGFLCMGTGLLGLVVLLVWPRRRERVK